MKCKQFILLLLFYCLFINASLLFAQPIISNFTPKSGTAGTLVTISGTNLLSPSSINIGGKAAIALSNNGTTLVAMVMPGAATGAVTVTTVGGSATGVGVFAILINQGVLLQQGNKLVGADIVGAAQQGYSVAISADGNTAIVGGYNDNNGAGAAWVVSRNGGVWIQQGNKLIGSDAAGKAQQGRSVALSADGNTAIIGGVQDGGNVGAAWVFARNGVGVWLQQGNKLVGSGSFGGSTQGQSVSLSADGNTALIGGNGDNNQVGAAWVFTRNSLGVWLQEGNKLVGSGSTGASAQGYSVALSADGNTAIVGGSYDNNYAGAAWVFSRNSSIWMQQGSKLVGTSASTNAQQGFSAAISADGNTAIIGGNYDNNYAGAAWVFSRNGLTWMQQGSKLVGAGTVGFEQQGVAVAISADGNTALIGGYGDSSITGAAWVYKRNVSVWSQQGKKLVGTGAAGGAGQGQSVALSADGYTAIIGGNSDNKNNGAAWVFTYIPPPTITNFSPANGPIGSLVTITGTNLSNPTAITIGGIAAIPISNNGSSLVAMVMPGALTGVVSVTTARGVSNSTGQFTVLSTKAPKSQQGNKLVGAGAIGNAQQGLSVAISADGKTAIVGGSNDNNGVGAAWIYTKNADVWMQQGDKLIGDVNGTGGIDQSNQGQSVAISADGNTVIVGGYNDNGGIGAAWIYTRIGNSWIQQGSKLVGKNGSATTRLGYSVSLSADGNTAVVGGSGDNNGVGAVWIFSRNNGTWFQEGNKLVGTGGSSDARQGYAVSLSADGKTMLVGGYNDNGGAGAVWIFTNKSGEWKQEGSKLIGSDAVGNASQGFSVSLNADGNTALIGGYLDNTGIGAAWVFKRNNGVWKQEGNKLIITEFIGIPSLGRSVALNADGNQAMLGGYGDNSNIGGAWYFLRENEKWTQNGKKIVGSNAIGGARQGFSIAMSADGVHSIMGGYLDDNQKGASWVFQYIPPPKIINFSPKSGPVGSLIRITGTNLSNSTSITIGAVAAIPISNDGNNLVIMVMPGTSNGTINLVTAEGAISSLDNFTVTSINPPNVQQGNKLVGTQTSINASQGGSVAISADGNTAIIGGRNDNGDAGAAWIYTRNNGVWLQQGNKLVGIGGSADAKQGTSVAISADGNTAIIGGNEDAGGVGAVWVFVRNNGIWIQQGNKLVGTGSIGASSQGIASSISADGNSIIVGATGDNAGIGAAWIFKRNGTIWTQQGNKLIGTGSIGNAYQGRSVAISADGNFAIVGGHNDNSGLGAAWVYKLTGSNWVQDGNKLIGTGNIGNANQGSSVGINADGNTAIVGAEADNISDGATWIFTRNNGVWSQQGNKLVGTGIEFASRQGSAVSISADGNTAIIGANSDNNGAGATWVYSRTNGVWNQSGKKLLGSGAVGSANQGSSIALSADGITAIIGGKADNTLTGASWIFTYIPPPIINIFSPTSGSVGTLVTIVGSNLGNAKSVIIAGRQAIIISNDGTNLVAMVMPGSTSGAIVITNDGGTVSFGNFNVIPTLSPNFQQGQKLVGTLGSASAQQGYSVAISADGNTAIVGGYNDNNLAGAAWIYTRNNSVWTQQGNKLIGIGGSTTAQQGWSVAISADGNTAIVGGYNDKGGVGAAWVYTRSGGIWTQQGEKLVGNGIEGLGNAQQGYSVAISADGNTALIGGNGDNFLAGATWVFMRSAGVWSQQGNKLVGNGAIGNARQGQAVSISADGNTAVVGGYNDNGGVGAIWMFLRNIGGVWAQQGNKLVGKGIIGNAQFGISVAVNADGNAAVIGGSGDNNGAGAAWIYTRSGGAVWSQQGNKLFPSDTTGAPGFGQSISISADGNTTMLGGFSDNGNVGAVWGFRRSVGVWTQQGSKLVGTGAVGNAKQGFSLSLSADGNTAISGGINDNNIAGAAWVFTNIPSSSITSATYNVSTGILEVTGINFIANPGPLNDIDVNRISITGEGNVIYALTSNPVEITNATSFTIKLNPTDSVALNLILNKNGTTSTGATVYNLAADDFWMTSSIAGNADLTGNIITVSNVAIPRIISANYNLSSGLLEVIATSLLKRNGSLNDIDVTKFIFSGQGGGTFTLTNNTSNVEINDATSFFINLGATDKAAVNVLLNKNGTSATDGTIYNLSATDDWNRGADVSTDISDLIDNTITVSGFPGISITVPFSATTISTVYGIASNSLSFNIAGTFMQSGILVTAPSGFEVSLDTTTFSNSITIGTAGTIASTKIYIRLKQGLLVNNYTGNVALSSTNVTTVNLATLTGIVTPKALTISGIIAINKAFDGNTLATIIGTPILNGVLITDIANIRIGGTVLATFANSNIGENIIVTIVGYTISGSAANNYSITQPTGIRANIFDAGVSIMPNPFFNELTVQLNAAATSSTSITRVRLLSVSGKEFKSVTVARGVSKIQLFGPELIAGLYLLEITNDKYQQTKVIYKY